MSVSFLVRRPLWLCAVTLLTALSLSACSVGTSARAPSNSPSDVDNTAPTISGTPAATVNVGVAYAFTPTAADGQGDLLQFSADNLPTWLELNVTTGEIHGTPTAADVGTTDGIELSVSDGKLSASLAAFSITVAPADTPNAPPVISGTPPTTLTAGSAYLFQPAATDPEGDALAFSIANAPSWASFDTATGRLAGTPANSDAGTYADVQISVGDGISTVTLPAFSIVVSMAPPPDMNHPPEISGAPATSVQAGSAYSFQPAATDVDGDSLTFSIVNKPSWAVFSTRTGHLSGTPTSSNVGVNPDIVISVGDGQDTASLPAFSLEVAAPVNRAPTISGTPATTVKAGSSYSFTPTTKDADGDSLTFSITNKPSWASFSTTTGRLSGTPDGTDVGTTSNIAISVSDGTVKATLSAFSIQVTNSNGAPSLSGTPATSVAAGASYAFTPTASDPDGNTLTFSITNKPSWATFSTSTGKLSGTPTSGNVGTTTGIVISVSDGTLSASLPAFSIQVTSAANSAPTISGSPPTSVSAGSAYSFTPSASDANGNSLTFSIASKPSWATFSTSTGKLSGTPAAGDVGTTSGIVISVSDGSLSAALPSFSITVTSVPVSSGAPLVLYTDLPAGPTTGGENDLGAYVSIFGKNFGSNASQVRVYFGNTEAAAYRYFGASKGRSDIQQITVQPGNVGTGSLSIKVVVNGVASNTDQTFLVNPGDILFVDNVSGNDGTAVKGDIAHPWRTVQTPSEGGALAAAGPGDVIVLRGKSTWSDVGFEKRWFRFRHATGSMPTGASGTGYIAIEAYPGENVHYVAPASTNGGIHGMGSNYSQFSDWIIISGLHIESAASSSSDGAPVNLQVASDHWRVVNNELGPWPASSGAKAGGLVGNGTDVKAFGNEIHDIDGGTENHCIYLDTAASNVEIAYNHIHDCVGGNIIQTYDNLGGGPITNISIHHNVMHDGNRYGLNMADGTVSVHAWNNVIYNTAYAGIRLNQNTSSASETYENNTLFNVCTNHPAEQGAIQNTWNITGGSVVFKNNIIARTGSGCSQGYSNSSSDSGITVSRNLYFGYADPTRDSNGLSGDPLFKNAAGADFRLQPGSPAIDAASGSGVTNDFDFKSRATPDLGAFEGGG